MLSETEYSNPGAAHRFAPYPSSSSGNEGLNQTVGPDNEWVTTKKPRKRTTRACDKCNKLRTKCDGLKPCSHCIEFKFECNYLRVPQKRGKASQTYKESLKNNKTDVKGESSQDDSNGDQMQKQKTVKKSKKSETPQPTPASAAVHVPSQAAPSQPRAPSQAPGPNGLQHNPNQPPPQQQQHDVVGPTSNHSSASSQHSQQSPLPSLSHYSGYPTVSAMNHDDPGPSELYAQLNPKVANNDAPAPQGTEPFSHNANLARRASTSSNNMALFTPLLAPSPGALFGQSPSWFNTMDNGGGSSNASGGPGVAENGSNNDQQGYSGQFYGQNNSMPMIISGDEKRAELSGSTQMVHLPPGLKYPVLLPIVDKLIAADIPLSLAQDLLETYFKHSTHVLAYLVRKHSILAERNPRRTEPSLLFAILTVAAHHSDNVLLTRTPATRQSYVDRLTALTTSHLLTTTDTTAVGSLDEVISYVQLGTIVSASEFKGSSLRWWASAWALAKELKLNEENPEQDPERREERRRTWWLLYMVDRHLGLCYNRPLVILDSECLDLYQPIDEDVWESTVSLTPPEMDPNRIRGLNYLVRGQGIYGYFLPLMTILGALLEIHHSEQNPLLPGTDHQQRMTIRTYLDQYAQSLKNWNHVPCPQSYENAWRDYAFQLVHVLNILSSVSWDPTEVLQHSDALVSSPEYTTVAGHAIAAAKAVRRILAVDPDLMLMPFFLGIYLLQGSFVLLAIVDRMESETPQEVVAACETIVHAHEVCIVTLNTEYQRNFRRVMRGTMSLISHTSSDKLTPQSINSQSPTNPLQMGPDGSLPEMSRGEKDEARKRRQDVLGLYRWTRGGHGLAV